MMEEQEIKLSFKNEKWLVEYSGLDALEYFYYEDAVFSMGLMAKESLKIFGIPVKTSIKLAQQHIEKESYLYPRHYLLTKDATLKI